MLVLPSGSWPSPVTPDTLVEQVVRLAELRAAAGALWWLEGRPAEGGRQALVRWTAGEGARDALPTDVAARTTVHEYGGGAYTVAADGSAVLSRFDDQRLWRLDPDGALAAITPEPATRWGARYADGQVVPGADVLVCVREGHAGPDAINEIVAVPLRGGDPEVLVTGRDFYAAPRPSPDGRRLAWLCWDHPNMPWDGTELWVADLDLDRAGGFGGAGGVGGSIRAAERVTGGPAESIGQPRWSPDGVLHWVSDRSGWWNLYREGVHLAPMEAELALPDWVFGQSSYTFLTDGRLVATWWSDGTAHLGVLRSDDSAFDPIGVPYTVLGSVQAWGDGVAALAASPRTEPAVVTIAVPSGDAEVLRPSRAPVLDEGWVSVPESIEFPTSGDRTAHALFYPPTSPEAAAPPGERPPLLVISHGGPTSATVAALSLGVQFWTTRGIGVVDVNYGGSTGYGRSYRERLQGAWGVVDVDDCVNAARYLVDRGDADPDRLVIRGGSAGGYTTLCALAFTDVFAAGSSHYGVGDLAALAAHTHKFESRYLDGLVGPLPDAEDVYRDRSPLHHADRIGCPVIIFQGLEDAVVPPAQAEVLVEALRRNRVPFAYLTFEGEQHGFRQASTIHRVATAELAFFGRVLGFDPADKVEPVTIEHEDALDEYEEEYEDALDEYEDGDDEYESVEEEELAWDLSEWEPQLRVLVDQALAHERIPHLWQDGDLLAPARYEAQLEAILDQIEYPEALEPDESEEAADDSIPELLSDLFVAADRLVRDPSHTGSVLEVLELADVLDDADLPFGFEVEDWAALLAMAAALSDALSERDDAEVVAGHARTLRDGLHRFV